MSNKTYSLDVSKANKIFDILLKDKQIILSDDHKLPTSEHRKGKKYCKFHHIYSHWSNNFIQFGDMIQDAIKDKHLKFEEKPMKVDIDPFQNQVTFAKPVQIMMVGIAE